MPALTCGARGTGLIYTTDKRKIMSPFVLGDQHKSSFVESPACLLIQFQDFPDSKQEATFSNL